LAHSPAALRVASPGRVGLTTCSARPGSATQRIPSVDGQSGRLDTHHSVNKPSHLSTNRIHTLTYCHLAWLHLRDTSSTNEYGERSRVIRHGIETLPTIAGSP